MGTDETKHPKLLSYLQRHNGLLYAVPAWVFERAYGLFSCHLPCPFNSSEILQNLERIGEAYALFTDESSKLTFLNTIMYRLTQHTDYIHRAYSPVPQYHVPAFRNLGSGEVYVDCGAFTGDSLAVYCRYNQPPRKAYLFEPDLESAEKLRQVAMTYPDMEANVITKGVYSKSGRLFFRAGDKFNSILLEKEQPGCIPIDVASIDDAIDGDISFLKMDIEGSERSAIIGAKAHILNSYPKLAICVYHQVSDLWEIPLMISDMFPDYQRYELHHHSNIFSETVLYVYR